MKTHKFTPPHPAGAGNGRNPRGLAGRRRIHFEGRQNCISDPFWPNSLRGNGLQIGAKLKSAGAALQKIGAKPKGAGATPQDSGQRAKNRGKSKKGRGKPLEIGAEGKNIGATLLGVGAKSKRTGAALQNSGQWVKISGRHPKIQRRHPGFVAGVQHSAPVSRDDRAWQLGLANRRFVPGKPICLQL